MAIREDLVASAAQFLQDPSVAASPIEKRIAFLQAKNLSQEEVSAALARAESGGPPPPYAQSPAYAQAAGPVAAQGGSPQYYGYPPYAWPQSTTEGPRRDWRDLFILATVVGGASYGLYNLGKRYVYPLIAPPTPERLEQDKKSVDEQFDKTFQLVEQLAKDTEVLKASEQERTERLDNALEELETVVRDLKTANRRRDDEAQRVRDDVQNLRDSIPRALNNQKDLTDNRLRELNTELKSLKTLISQRMNPTATSTSVNNYLRPNANGNVIPSSAPATPALGGENVDPSSRAASVQDEQPRYQQEQPIVQPAAPKPSPFSSGIASAGKPTIPAWQLAMANKTPSASTVGVTNGTANDGASSNGGDEAA
ncbi:hypothetical protein SMACR_06325 [Sordaria macrospora]|uniref:Peroxisomal membrane protein PEX14 n=2 Tax=Sordaria macrospora TaxID=5147 RepID=F7W6G8_SORMK|nr:uncharacterized protein SMAC_06325 [Sordaria macrospora k-hell]KAA8635188.1 hypothetical protein SMACR_06325 [Sordaria macrospora]KAH7630401.1 peroxisomal membrane anchor protein conserved region-domain-containing protein [Sordaria sp. MPI-SDFR-AT-0083]WPJ67068.1 hypothetical protein SMAC4_06325 [Sordaria macrospora]CCC13107.1 unnamed protein product [Sordaria macrospora k-hell]